MKILTRPQKGHYHWQVVESSAYSDESQLQKLLDESPEVVSLEEIRLGAGQLVATIREFNLPVGYIDLLAFTAQGDIAIIECKQAKNTQAKREVIGQILDYAAHLWEMTYEDLDDKVQLLKSMSLADFVRGKINAGEEWDEEQFRANVRAGLADGNFILVIVVDEINDELSRIVRYVNATGSPSFSFAALEMRRFTTEETEMLVPHVFGQVRAAPKQSTAAKNKWSEETFFPELRRRCGDKDEAIAHAILEWCEQKKMQIWWGEGSRSGSFVPTFNTNGNNNQLFAIYTYGRVEIYFQWYQYRPPFDLKDKRMEMLQRLNEIAQTKLPVGAIEKRPSIPLSDLSQPQALAMFFEIFDWFIAEVKTAAGSNVLQN
jgi:hypothetical protein